jgi:hypothetical protein
MEILKNFKPNLIPNNPKDDSFNREAIISKNGGHSMYMATLKKDGCRLQLIEGKVLTRSLKEPKSRLVVSRFQEIAERLAAVNVAVDGEFYKHGLKFNEIFRFFSKEDVTDPKYKVKLEKELAKNPEKFKKDYEGRDIEFLTTFPNDLKIWIFDGIITDAPGLTGYQDRMIELNHRIREAGLIDHIHIEMPHYLPLKDESSLEELFNTSLDEGWEGLVLTHRAHEYKYGRNSLSQGTLLKLKNDSLEYDGVVLDVLEATQIKEGVERTTNELGRSVTSKKIGDREKSGMAKAFLVEFSDDNGQYIGTFMVGLKGFDNTDKIELLENKDKYIGRHFTYTAMAPVKDFPRHAYFRNWRDNK